MADRTLRAIITGDSSGAVKAFEDTSVASDAAADGMSSKFDKATSETGGYISRIGTAAENAGIPFAGALTNMGSKMDDAKSKGNGLKEGLSALGGVTLAVGAVGIAAVGYESIKLGESFQKTTASIASNAGISTAAAQKIGNAFQGTAFTTIYSGQQIGQAYAAVAAQLGATQGKALNSSQAMTVMSASMDLAEASGESLGSATGSLAGVMQAYGIKAGGASKASDVLYSSAKLTGNTVDSLASAVEKMHSKLGAASPSLADTGGLLVDLAQHGETGRAALSAVSSAMQTMLKSSTAVTSAQTALVTATDSLPPSLKSLGEQYSKGTLTQTQVTAATKGMTVAQSEAWKTFTTAESAAQKSTSTYNNLGIQVVNAQGKFVGMKSVIAQLGPALQGMTQQQQMAALTSIFGAGASQKLLTTIEAGPAAFDKASAAAAKTGAAHAAAAKESQTFDHQMETLKSGLEDYGSIIGAKLLPILQKLATDVAKLVTWFSKHKDVALALAAAIGGVLTIAVGVFVEQKLAKMAKSVQGAIQDFGKLKDGVVSLASKFSSSGDAASAASDEMSESLVTVGAAGDTAAEGEIAASAGADALDVSLLPIIATIGLIVAAFAIVGVAAYEIVTHWSAVEGFLKKIWGDIESFAKKVFGDVLNFFKKWGLDLLLVFAPMIGIPLLLATHWHQVESDAKAIWGDIVTFFMSIPGKIMAVFSDAGSWLLDAGKKILDGLITGFTYLTPEGLIIKFHSQILGALSGAATWLFNEGKDILTGLFNGITSVVVDIFNFFIELPAKILNAIGDLASKMLTAGEDAMKGLLKGITDGAKAVVDKVKGIGGDILHGLSDAVGWLSPWTSMIKAGGDAMTGLAQGITSNSHLPVNALSSVGQRLVNGSGTFRPSAIGATIAAGGTSNPALVAGGSAVSSPASVAASLPPMPLHLTIEMDGQTVATIIAPDVRTALLQQARGLPGRSIFGGYA